MLLAFLIEHKIVTLLLNFSLFHHAIGQITNTVREIPDFFQGVMPHLEITDVLQLKTHCCRPS